MSRDTVLARIRAALETTGGAPAAAVQASVSRSSSEQPAASVSALFEHRVAEYGARIYHSPAQALRETIANILRHLGKQAMAVPPGISPDWLDPDITWLPDEALSLAQLSGVDGVLTAATAAIAESGSIVLQHGPTEGRRALTLLPDYHLCVLRTEQIVATLPACLERLLPTADRLTTFISGPSATADIEMTRIQGVHGPRSLDVILVE